MMAKLSDLTTSALNVRKSGTDIGLEMLATSIHELGLILPIAVRPGKKGKKKVFEIVDGHRRFAALQLLAETGRIGKDAEVPVNVIEGDDAAVRQRSLAANVQRLPLHPVDQYEAFAAIAGDGIEAEDISRRFGITTRQVRQVLALGTLHEGIRSAWKEGKLREDEARAFTVCEDRARQWDVFEELAKKNYGLSSWAIKKALIGDESANEGALEFVTEPTYVAAGGRITQDLFSETRYVSDMPLLLRLKGEKLDQIADQLLAAGYAWAYPAGAPEIAGLGWNRQANDFWPHQQEDEPSEDDEALDDLTWALTGFEPVKRENYGIVLRVSHIGALELMAFTAQAADADMPSTINADGEPMPAEEKAEDPAAISGALQQTVAEWRTRAYQKAFARSPVALLQLMIAAATGIFCGVFSRSGREFTGRRDGWADTLRDILQRDYQPDTDTLLAMLAERYSACVSTMGASAEDLADLAMALDAEVLRTELVEAFNPQEYFSRTPLRVIQAFNDELAANPHVNKDRHLVKGKLPLIKPTKRDAEDWAARKAKEFGWLPPAMRVLDIEAFGPEWIDQLDQIHQEAAE